MTIVIISRTTTYENTQPTISTLCTFTHMHAYKEFLKLPPPPAEIKVEWSFGNKCNGTLEQLGDKEIGYKFYKSIKPMIYKYIFS